VSENLVESELFGHEAGAFTGAVRTREGKLEAASKGTLYLDEIDSMPLAAQAKLLRALQERGAERVGGSRFYRADFRVIASTKVALPELVAQQRFRMDLYFRLNVVRINLPPLRELRERIVPLFERFCAEAAQQHRLPAQALSPATRAQLLNHPWPGNVRELLNASQRHALGLPPLDRDVATVCMTPPTPVPSTPAAAVAPPPSSDPDGAALRERLRAYEREVIVSTLKRHNGSVARASTELQVPPNTLYYRIKTLGIQFLPE
jgi:two-component system C4-dicarboxylate transport response regulator DctD